MKLSEAYKILELNNNAQPDVVKKKYRELSRKYHPDLNKDPGAEDKFKQISEAYSTIQKGEDEEMDIPTGFNPFSPFGSTFKRSKVRNETNIVISTNISFAESVLGIKKEISFNRKGKCNDCDGQGSVPINNGCEKCKGKGQVTIRQNNMIFVQTCNQCAGRTKVKNCNTCNSTGAIETQVNLNVNIPAGVTNNNILRLAGMGNYLGSSSFAGMVAGDHFTDVHLHIHVEQDPVLRLEGETVFCNLQLSLLEALKGCAKTVKTVLGERDIVINPLSKNNDQITIQNVGIRGIGDQKVILEVMYPTNISKLIDLLEAEV